MPEFAVTARAKFAPPKNTELRTVTFPNAFSNVPTLEVFKRNRQLSNMASKTTTRVLMEPDPVANCTPVIRIEAAV